MLISLFILLLIASAFFSGSETAYLSLNKIRLDKLDSLTTPSSNRIVSLLEDPNKLLVTILVGNTLVNIAASSVFADMVYSYFGESGVGISIVLMTLIVLVFGEVTPKMLALAHAEKFSSLASLPLKIMEKIFAPARVMLSGASYAMVKSMGIDVRTHKPRITEQDIRSLFSISKIKGVVKKKEQDMIESILEFKELNAADIMTPRIEVQAIDLTLERDELIHKIKESKCSRLPVYMHSLDNVVGIIYSKEFLLNPYAPVKDMVKRPFFVPESKRIDELLEELQGKHVHMAVVADEYGVTSGIVTIEDILEEIVGEIADEHDFEEPNIHKVDQKTFEVQGQTHIDEVNEELALGIATDEVDTIGGYVILVMGKIPQAGDYIEVNGFRLTVNDVSKNRITMVTVEIIQ